MSTSASGSAAGYISLLIISITYMLLTFRSHMHTSDVTNMLIIFFWIKLPLKLPNFLIIQKRDRHFSVTGFAQMLKPNTFEGAHYKMWPKGVLCGLLLCTAFSLSNLDRLDHILLRMSSGS